MDSIEEERKPSGTKNEKLDPSHDKKKSPIKNMDIRNSMQLPGDNLPTAGLFEQSPSSTVKDLQRKLDQIQSPSESKVSEDDGDSRS